MKLVVTGCNGRVGKRAVLLALKRGYTVTGIDLTPFSDELASAIQQDQYSERFTFRQIDLKEYNPVFEALQTSKCEAVVHLAAYPNPDDYKVVTHNWFDPPGSLS
jgi:nucleoside-diphosphate-sugar epimerase